MDDVIIGGEYWRGKYWNTTEPELIPRIRTFSIDTVVEILSGVFGEEKAMYCMDNWIHDKPVLESKDARMFRDAWVRPLLSKAFAVNYAKMAIRFHNSSLNHQGNKLWNRSLRMALTAKHLNETGELECRFGVLKSIYGVTQLEHVNQLFVEITGLVS
ncbi:MAG: hypothetical protein ACFFEA_13635 [Candidatus Thorarchaeota archaeon]